MCLQVKSYDFLAKDGEPIHPGQPLPPRTPWFGGMFTARCERCSDQPPMATCGCGLRIYRERRLICQEPGDPMAGTGWTNVITEVAGWGKVIEHERGWRVEQMRLLNLSIVCSKCFDYNGVIQRASMVRVFSKSIESLCPRHDQTKRRGRSKCDTPDELSTFSIEAEMLGRYDLPPHSSALGVFSTDPVQPTPEEQERLSKIVNKKQRANLLNAIATGAEILEDAWTPLGREIRTRNYAPRWRRPTSPDDCLLIHGIAEGSLVFMPKHLATRLAITHKALANARACKTWGEFRKVVPVPIYEEVMEMFRDQEAYESFDQFYCDYQASEAYASLDEANREFQRLRVGERFPLAEDHFDVLDIPSLADGDWPGWPQQLMLDWMPPMIKKRYGAVHVTTLNGDFLTFSAEDEEDIVKALHKYGFVCSKDQALVTKVSKP